MALTDIALCLVADVETELSIATGTQDAKLERMIHSVSEFFAQYCNRTFFYTAGIEESFAGFGTPFIQLARWPIVTLTSITHDGNTVDSDNYEIFNSESATVRHVNNWIWTTKSTPDVTQDPMVGMERKLYEATYTAGWVTASQKAIDAGLPARSLPFDLEDACIQVVAGRFRSEGFNPTIKSEQLMSYSTSYRSAPSAKDQFAVLYPFAASILKRYRRPSFA